MAQTCAFKRRVHFVLKANFYTFKMLLDITIDNIVNANNTSFHTTSIRLNKSTWSCK